MQEMEVGSFISHLRSETVHFLTSVFLPNYLYVPLSRSETYNLGRAKRSGRPVTTGFTETAA